MKYEGYELVEVTKSQIFDPPKEMLLWDNKSTSPKRDEVFAIVNGEREYRVITRTSSWHHCAEIPKPKNVTHRELAQWLAQGKGEMRSGNLTMTFTNLAYDFSMADDPIDERVIVRKWDDTGWISPTREYLGLED